MSDVTAYLQASQQGQRFVLAAGDIGDAQASGEWLATTEPVEVRE